MTRRSKALLTAALLFLPLLAAGCNTIEGAGQDIKNTGAWIEKKANTNK